MAISGTLSNADLVKMANAKIEVDIGGAGSAWAAIESWANTLEATRGKIPTANDPTLDGERHNSVGVQEVSRVRVTILYDEAAGGPAANLYGQLGNDVDIRWSKSGTAGDKRYYTADGKLIDCSPPAFNASQNGNTKITFEIEAPGDISVETIPGTT